MCVLLGRSEFGGIVRTVTQLVIMKCKEKRLLGEVSQCLTAVLTHCIAFEPLLEDICEHIRNKKIPPHGRCCLLDFVMHALSALPEKVSADCMKPLAEAIISSCDDSDPKVRESCCSTLASLATVVRAKGRPAADAYKLLMSLETVRAM